MAFVEEHYPTAVPFFALCMFAGIRPCLRTGEILRRQPAHFKLEANLIRIDGEVSKMAEGASLEERGVRATVALYCIRPDLIGDASLEEIGHSGGRSKQAVHQLADSFRETTGFAP